MLPMFQWPMQIIGRFQPVWDDVVAKHAATNESCHVDLKDAVCDNVICHSGRTGAPTTHGHALTEGEKHIFVIHLETNL